MTAIAKRLEGVNEYYFSRKLKEIEGLNRQGKEIINLGIGSPDLPPHPDVIKTLQDECSKPNVHAYQSYKGAKVLRDGMAQWYSKWYQVTLDPETEILPLIGSKEGIMHTCMTYLNEGDLAWVPDPGYPTYASAVTLAGAQPVTYNLTAENGYLPVIGELEQALTQNGKRIKLMLLNYPHMPTGTLPRQQVFEKLVAFARQHQILLVHDNPYSFILNDHPRSILSVEGAKEVAIELNSLSKSHNMAGWRVGMITGAEDRINEILKFKSNMDSGMFLPVQLAAAKALTLDEDWFAGLNEVYKRRKALACEILDTVGCAYTKDQSGMFVWAKIPPAFANCFDLSDHILYEKNIFITPGGIFGQNGLQYVRISLCKPEAELNRVLERLR